MVNEMIHVKYFDQHLAPRRHLGKLSSVLLLLSSLLLILFIKLQLHMFSLLQLCRFLMLWLREKFENPEAWNLLLALWVVWLIPFLFSPGPLLFPPGPEPFPFISILYLKEANCQVWFVHCLTECANITSCFEATCRDDTEAVNILCYFFSWCA